MPIYFFRLILLISYIMKIRINSWSWKEMIFFDKIINLKSKLFSRLPSCKLKSVGLLLYKSVWGQFFFFFFLLKTWKFLLFLRRVRFSEASPPPLTVKGVKGPKVSSRIFVSYFRLSLLATLLYISALIRSAGCRVAGRGKRKDKILKISAVQRRCSKLKFFRIQFSIFLVCIVLSF